MANKMSKTAGPGKKRLVEDLFEEVQQEVNEDIVRDAKLKIKDLIQQKTKAEKVVSNINRQIDDLKLRISQDLA